jgi:putative alpha-1,2-mannosidase
VRWNFAIILVAACGDSVSAPLPEVTDPIPLVDPTIGTGGLGFAYGSCFVGAAAPHGFAKPGPDTNGPLGTVQFEHYSGYFAQDDRIQAFTSVHLHGAGATDYGVLGVMPTLAFDPTKTSAADYEAHFVKADEHASAGLYKVTLDSGIVAELTATQRVAVERFTLPAPGALVIDLAKTLTDGKVDAPTIAIDDAGQQITGSLHHVGDMSTGFGGYTIYFAIRGAWTSHTGWTTGAALMVPAGATTLAIGLSLVSLDGAKANLATEVPQVDFDAVAAATQDAWREKIGVVALTGGTEVQRRIFYTSLYHAFLMPSVIDDVSGVYQLVGTGPLQENGWHQMSDLSLWDTYRTVSSLYAWLAPESAHDTARSLVGFGDGLGAYPRWPLAIGETGTMIGAPSEIVIADAVARGVPDPGGDLAWPLLRAEAMDATPPPGGRGERANVDVYMQYGYVPTSVDSSVSLTTEFAHADFALGQLAGALGNTADHDALIARSHGWRMLYDPSTGFLRAKSETGAFSSRPFDPTNGSDPAYREADAWQSLWMPGIHDPDGMASTFGSAEAVVAKLSDMFDRTKTDWDSGDPSEVNFPRPYYWAGNEPDLDAVFVFALMGRPDLTQQWLRWIEDNVYTDQPTGVPGNDDGGTMGAWYVLSTLGLYPVAGSDGWVIGAPMFPKARIDVGGHELVIVAEGQGTYVQSVDLDGQSVTTPHLTQAQLVQAGTLHFVMGSSPSHWGM